MPETKKKPFKNIADFTPIEALNPNNQPSFSHTITIYRKTKNNTLWFIKQVESEELAILETISQQILLLLDNDQDVSDLKQPKTRYIVEVDPKTGEKRFYVISKFIPNFDAFTFDEDYAHEIYSGKLEGLARTVVVELFVGEVDLKSGNIGTVKVNKSGHTFLKVISVDGGLGLASINPDYESYISREQELNITKEDIESLPNLANFHAYNWLDFVNGEYTQTIFQKLIPILNHSYFDSDEFKQAILMIKEYRNNPKFQQKNEKYRKEVTLTIQSILAPLKIANFPLLKLFLNGWNKEQLLNPNNLPILRDYCTEKVLQNLPRILAYPYFDSVQFKQIIERLRPPEVHIDKIKAAVKPILTRSELPNIDLITLFLRGWNKVHIANHLNKIERHAKIAAYAPFEQERNRTILQLSILPETLFYEFVHSYTPEDQGNLAAKIIQTLIQRQQQLITEARKIDSFCRYAESSEAQEDIIAFVEYISTFKTMGQSLLLNAALKEEIYRKFISNYKTIRLSLAEINIYPEAQNIVDFVKQLKSTDAEAPILNLQKETFRHFIPGYKAICLFSTELDAYITKKTNKKITIFFYIKTWCKLELAKHLCTSINYYLENPSVAQRNRVYANLLFVKKELEDLEPKSSFTKALDTILSCLPESSDNFLQPENKESKGYSSNVFFKSKPKIPVRELLVQSQFHFHPYKI